MAPFDYREFIRKMPKMAKANPLAIARPQIPQMLKVAQGATRKVGKVAKKAGTGGVARRVGPVRITRKKRGQRPTREVRY